MTLDDTLATLQESLAANGVAKDVIAKVLRDLRKAQEEEKADKPPAKRSKAQYTILVSDTDGRLKGMELTGWVVKLDETAPPQAAYERIVEAAGAFNRSSRGKKAPLESFGDAVSALRGKWLKRDNPDEKTAILTRHPVAIQSVSNILAP